MDELQTLDRESAASRISSISSQYITHHFHVHADRHKAVTLMNQSVRKEQVENKQCKLHLRYLSGNIAGGVSFVDMPGPLPHSRGLHKKLMACRPFSFPASTFGKGAPQDDMARTSWELRNKQWIFSQFLAISMRPDGYGQGWGDLGRGLGGGRGIDEEGRGAQSGEQHIDLAI